MSRGIQQSSIFIILFLLGCAAQGPVTGGPADEKGPMLITVQPANASLNIAQEQKISLTFDELIDPVSIPSSIKIEFDALKIIAEHRVLKFFLFLLSHFPQLPSILGTPREFPEPKIINFVF